MVWHLPFTCISEKMYSWIEISWGFLGWKQKICSVEVLIWFSWTRGSELRGLCWKRLGPGTLQWGQPRVFSGARGNGILCQGTKTAIPKVGKWTEDIQNYCSKIKNLQVNNNNNSTSIIIAYPLHNVRGSETGLCTSDDVWLSTCRCMNIVNSFTLKNVWHVAVIFDFLSTCR